jgi:TrmH family RNA methyltransferase
VQRLRRLVRQRSARQAEQVFVVEGAKVLAEALRAEAGLEALFLGPGADEGLAEDAMARGARVFRLEPGVLERVADTVSPQPEIAIVRDIAVPLEAVATASLLVVCVDVRDPGNAGTILRSAEASGADGVICCEGSVDLFNPKAVRASAGSLFHVPVVAGGDPVAVLQQIGDWGQRRLGAVARAGTDYAALDLTAPTAFVLGNEANGLPPAVEPLIDEGVSIPMAGHAESLNVGMAAAVLCFEASRQRRLATRASQGAGAS